MSKQGLPQINAHACGIDIGCENNHVSVDGKTVKVFPTFTESLSDIVKYLLESKIETVAMESTGVLWIPLYDILVSSGIEVYLVNSTHVKNIPAQKSDFQDCRWLQKTHSYGLLRASFIPTETIRELRTYVRHRESLVDTSSQNIQRMQKAFELMNIKFHNVISDITGVSGIKVIESILSGERNNKKLLSLCDARIKKGKSKEVLLSLQGNFKKEYLFLLSQSYQSYQFFQEQILNCDKEIEIILSQITEELPSPPSTPSNPARHNQPKVKNLHDMMVQMLGGRDATVLPGYNDKTLLKLISETGTDLSIWPTEKHFTSWAGLSPRKKQSGKMNRTHKINVKTKVGQIFRESAYSIANSKYIALKGFYARIKSKHGYKTAIKATARKLAVLYYRFIVYGIDYVEKGLKIYDEKYNAVLLKNLTKKARGFGYTLVKD
jgi:transposase